MNVTELTPVPPEALPVADLAEHLRLASGFAPDPGQDALLRGVLRAALAAIEARTSKAILQRDFRLTVAAWRDLAEQALPVAPVTAVAALRIVDRLEVAVTADPAGWRLVRDTHRPLVRSVGFTLPTIPVGGRAEIDFTAGYGAVWSEVPGDLRQAVLMLAAEFHDNRAADRGIPEAVAALVAPYRHVRLWGLS
jgi:uncharacterized phiE125 gp8 family phage protein